RRTRRAPTREAPAAPRPRTGWKARPRRARRGGRSRRHPLPRGLEPRERAELVVAEPALELGERLAVVAFLEPAAHETRDRGLELLARHAAEERAADRRRRAERAAHEHVVRRHAVAVPVLARRRLEAEVADPVLRARVRATVEVKPQLADLRPERRLEVLDERLQPRLRLADGEVAVRLTRARDGVGPDLVRVERQAHLGQARDRLVDAVLGDTRDDEVLLPGQTHVASEVGGEIGDGDQLV